MLKQKTGNSRCSSYSLPPNIVMPARYLLSIFMTYFSFSPACYWVPKKPHSYSCTIFDHDHLVRRERLFKESKMRTWRMENEWEGKVITFWLKTWSRAGKQMMSQEERKVLSGHFLPYPDEIKMKQKCSLSHFPFLRRDRCVSFMIRLGLLSNAMWLFVMIMEFSRSGMLFSHVYSIFHQWKSRSSIQIMCVLWFWLFRFPFRLGERCNNSTINTDHLPSFCSVFSKWWKEWRREKMW